MKGRIIEWQSNESLHLKALVQKLIDYAFKAAKRAANELSNPEEVQRIIRQQEQARDAKQRLDEALAWKE